MYELAKVRRKPLRPAQMPVVNETRAVELRKIMVEGEDFVVTKTCMGKRRELCTICGNLIKRRDQRCR